MLILTNHNIHISFLFISTTIESKNKERRKNTNLNELKRCRMHKNERLLLLFVFWFWAVVFGVWTSVNAEGSCWDRQRHVLVRDNTKRSKTTKKVILQVKTSYIYTPIYIYLCIYIHTDADIMIYIHIYIHNCFLLFVLLMQKSCLQSLLHIKPLKLPVSLCVLLLH